MNRFAQNEQSVIEKIIYPLPIIAFLLLLILFWNGIGSVSDTTAAKQKESLETALSRSIAQCYAVEGMYPPDLDYLKDHYGLTYDERYFYVDYDAFGSNLVPEFTVLRKNNQ